MDFKDMDFAEDSTSKKSSKKKKSENVTLSQDAYVAFLEAALQTKL